MSSKTYTVKSPNTSFKGVRCGVRFESGEGKATAEQARQLVALGYESSVPKAPDDKSPKAERHAEFRKELEAIQGIGEKTSQTLVEHGIEGVTVLAATDAWTLAEAITADPEKVEGWIEEAKEIVAKAGA